MVKLKGCFSYHPLLGRIKEKLLVAHDVISTQLTIGQESLSSKGQIISE
jgi:hypothetical protein